MEAIRMDATNYQYYHFTPIGNPIVGSLLSQLHYDVNKAMVSIAFTGLDPESSFGRLGAILTGASTKYFKALRESTPL